MKAPDEIYWIIFNKVIRPDRIDHMAYRLGEESINGIPKSIILKGNIITIEFEDGKKHVIHYNSDCELFYRKIEKLNEKEKTVRGSKGNHINK